MAEDRRSTSTSNGSRLVRLQQAYEMADKYLSLSVHMSLKLWNLIFLLRQKDCLRKNCAGIKIMLC